MTRITQILCPVDFSEVAQHALDHAAAMARWHGARLTVLHVFVNRPSLDLPPLVLEDAERQRLTAGMRRMAAAVPAEVPVAFMVEEAEYVHEKLRALVAAMHTDLLVLGTHGRSGFQRLFLGSVTEKVIRTATCPTLVVPPRAPGVSAATPIQFRRILCPVDFSQSSLDGLASAINVAEDAAAHLTLLHVVEMSPALGEDAAMLEPDLSRFRDAAIADSHRKLHGLMPEPARTHCTVDTAVVEGRAHREVLRQAAERHSDLIVMGVHGRGALDRLVLGSTTHQVIRAATCPVLVVRGG